MKHSQVTIFGNVGRDPELKVVGQKGTSLANFSVAVSTYDKGDYKTIWFRVDAWGKLAERIADKVSKGDKVTVMGSFRQNEWTDKEGRERKDLILVADEVLGGSSKPAIDTRQSADDDIPF